MRQEIERWLSQSDKDFEAAQYNFKGELYYIAAFLCQQAVEKALKALFLLEKSGEVPQSHSLIYLASETNIPSEYISFLKELTPKFVDTRYPDASVDLPSSIYDEENTKRIMDKSGEILKWIHNRMRS